MPPSVVVFLAIACSFTLQFNAAEADYTLDDSFWNDETPAGEVERLLREYRQNQELVRNIGAHYYQIIYPVQLRHHEKMGISTREVGAPKFPSRGSGGYGDSNFPGASRGRSRTGKHFHRTSLLIKAFNHKFRLDLELNTQLLAPNLIQKHHLPSAEQVSKQEIEHCYYHGTVKDYPGASAAFHTCNGVSGVIHVGNETFVIHPFYGGDLSKHPHVIFEARTKTNKGCANSGNMEWRMTHHRRQKHLSSGGGGGTSSLVDEPSNNSAEITPSATSRTRRDVREATKFIETALVIDKAMFDKRNGSTRAEVVHDAIQVANIADLYFRTLNTRVSVVYIETWQGSNQAPIDKSQDISRALLNFNDYTSRKLYKIDKDTTQLLTGETFQGGEAGMAVPETVCTAKSVGINVDVNVYEPHLLAGTVAHMIGHNIGMGHDDGREECICRDWHGCIMAQSIVGLENVQPYKFSECSKNDYIDALRIGHGICLLNKPNELEMHRSCGNNIVEEGEDCDCGTIEECRVNDPCCDPITCKLTKEAECATGPCCENCKLKPVGVVCREELNECDLPEQCSGDAGRCPTDIFKKNGTPCGDKTGYCFNGTCPTVDFQCRDIWGYGSISADEQCFEQFNSKGSINGHCGQDARGHFVKCEPENVRCGSLQCQMGYKYPVIAGVEQPYSRTIISIKGKEYECKAASGSADQLPNKGLVMDGSPCGDNLICINQTCTSIFPFMDTSKCPSNHNNLECSGHGVCTNQNKCFCDSGYGGPDCSMVIEMTYPPAYSNMEGQMTTMSSAEKARSELEKRMEKKESQYGDTDNRQQTLSLVLIMVALLLTIFIGFALIAKFCRSHSAPKYEPSYVQKPVKKVYDASQANHMHDDNVSIDSVNKMLTFGDVGTNHRCFKSGAKRGDSQRVLFRPVNHNMSAGPVHFQDHQRQMRTSVGSAGDDDLQQGDQILNIGVNAPISDVERTLKSLNGYHEDILAALRRAAASTNHLPETGSGPTTSTPTGGTTLQSEELLLKALAECNALIGSSGGYSRSSRTGSRENICDGNTSLHTVIVEGSPRYHHHHRLRHEDDDDDDMETPCAPLRIRNINDLLIGDSARRMSPSGSEDIRMSETEADRHYRLETSTVCSDTPTRRCRSRGEEHRFVYGRYRQGPGSSSGRHSATSYPLHHSHSRHHIHDDEGIYETADRNNGLDQTPDSESDEFIQAQQQLARWASEETLSPPLAHLPTMLNGNATGACGNVVVANGMTPREYFPSPVSTISSDNSSQGGQSIARAPPPIKTTQLPPPLPPPDSDNDSSRDTAASSSVSGAEQLGTVFPKRYPEYKH